MKGGVGREIRRGRGTNPQEAEGRAGGDGVDGKKSKTIREQP